MICRAYAAGLLDGEGCIRLQVRKRARPALTVTISNQHFGVLEELRVIYGGFVAHANHRDTAHGQRPVFNWVLWGTHAAAFLELLMPYLRIKRDQAVVALEAHVGITMRLRGDRDRAAEDRWSEQLREMKWGKVA